MISAKIPLLLKEVKFQTTRSGGKGGQNVNKVETKVELYFDVAASVNLDDLEKEKLLTGLKNKTGNKGVLKISAQSERTQFANKQLAIKKFEKLLVKIFKVHKKRIPVTISKEDIENRLHEKKISCRKKRETEKRLRIILPLLFPIKF